MSSLAAATTVIGFLVLVGVPVLWLIRRNGAGDEYLVDLRQPDPRVVYLQHDSGRQFELAATLAEFLRLPRPQAVEADD